MIRPAREYPRPRRVPSSPIPALGELELACAGAAAQAASRLEPKPQRHSALGDTLAAEHRFALALGEASLGTYGAALEGED